jgi:hypothetical protein
VVKSLSLAGRAFGPAGRLTESTALTDKMVSKLFQGLAAPKACMKVDTTPLDSFLEKLLGAVLQTDADLAKLREENAALKKDVVALQASDARTMRVELSDVIKRVQELESKFEAANLKLQQKADNDDLSEVREQAESGNRVAMEVSNNFSNFKVEAAKQTKEIRTQISSISNQLNEQISKLAESKANKSDMAQCSSKAENAAQQCERNTIDLKECLRASAEFMARAESELAKKVGFDAINDKIGRMECDDLLKILSNEMQDRIRRSNKTMQEMREDIDVLLTMVMQDANMGAGTTMGMVHCISCQKPVAVHRPGPPAGTGREPVMVQGKDRHMYRAAKDPDGEYTPIWQSSQITVTPARPATADPAAALDRRTDRRASTEGLDRRADAPAKSPDKPRPARPASAKVRKVPPL